LFQSRFANPKGNREVDMTAARRVLVVDDDAALCELIADIARDHGHEPITVTDPLRVMPLVEQQDFDLVISDVRMPGMDGIELIAQLRAYDPRIPIVAITAFGSIETAVRAVRAGAVDYLPKPFQPKDMALRMEQALERRAMNLELARLRTEAAGRFSVAGIVGKSSALRDVIGLVQRVADLPVTILITGPSGSGKELIARAIHGEGRRRTQPFVAVNCAAIPDGLLEAELFGVKKGAYTDARTDRPGMFQEAHGGTLFLDEVGELAPGLQAKLLRALEEREVRRVGAVEAEAVDVRILAATNRDLRTAVRSRTYRDDLYYRLAVIEIGIPPLRDRPDDIVPLTEHFVAKAAARCNKNIAGLSGAAIKRLLGYDWPGNVRELQNAVERAVALCDGDRISPDDLLDASKQRGPMSLLDFAADRLRTIDELDREYAALILQRTGGNKKRAASLLGVDRRTLQRWFGSGDEREDD
jgi:DNA-binding NtrC family response regulator